MKVKEIRCPYCKAPITKIGIDLGKVTCEYCNQSFIIEKENETSLEKFFRVMHEEDKRQAEYQKTDEYKQEQKKNTRMVIIYLVGYILLILFLLIIGKLFS